MTCHYCNDHGGAKAGTACPICGKISTTDDVDICHICGSEMAVVGPEQRTYCYTCGDFTINLPL
jgi:rRNA maturation endonuclease Nob1